VNGSGRLPSGDRTADCACDQALSAEASDLQHYARTVRRLQSLAPLGVSIDVGVCFLSKDIDIALFHQHSRVVHSGA
jgi:hypothetical protein